MANQDRVGHRLFQQVAGNQKVFRVYDDTLVFVDPADATKRVRLDVGDVTTATTRVLTVPDYDVILGPVGGRRSVISANAIDDTAVVTLTDDQSGALIDIDLATVTINLPALSASNAGANGIYFSFVVTTAATAQIIKAQSGDILHGGVIASSTTAGGTDAFSANGTSNLVITMNGTTQGGVPGSRWEVWAESATKWVVSGATIGSGTLVTPFSDT